MYKNELDGYCVGDAVKIKHTAQQMTITHLETRLLRDNLCSLIYQLPDGKMNTLDYVPIRSIRKVQ